jgi:hypothetical protein
VIVKQKIYKRPSNYYLWRFSRRPACVTRLKLIDTAVMRYNDWHSGDVVHALYMASQRFKPQTLHTDSEAASDDDASDEQPALVDSDSDAS